MKKEKQVRYLCVDAVHNTYLCSGCGFLANFEADGPPQNGRTVCPHCAEEIAHDATV